MDEQYALGKYQPLINRAPAEADAKSCVRKIWTRDASLWKDNSDHQRIIKNALCWLAVAAGRQFIAIADPDTSLERLAKEQADQPHLGDSLRNE